MTLNSPANLDYFHRRRETINERNATTTEPRRSQLSRLAEFYAELTRVDLAPEERAKIEANLAEHLGVMDGTRRTTPF